MAIAFVATFAHNETISGTSIATASATPSAGGFIGGWAIGPAISGITNITDSVSGALNLSTNLIDFGVVSGTSRHLYFFYEQNVTAAARTFTINVSSAVPLAIIAIAYSGIATTGNVIDVSAGQTGNTATAQTPTTNSTQSANELAMFCAQTSGGPTFSSGNITVGSNSGFNGRGNNNIGSGGPTYDVADLIATSTGAAQGHISLGSAMQWLAAIVTISATNVVRLVQTVTGGAASTSAASFPLTISGVAAGNVLTAQMTCSVVGGTSQKFAIPTDTNGTWASGVLPSEFIPVGTAHLNNAAAGTHTVTFALQSGSMSSYHFTLCEWSGFASNVMVVDVSNTGSASTAQALSLGSVSPSSSNEIVLAAIGVGASPGVTNVSITDPPTGFTSLQVGNNDQTDIAFEHSYKISSGTASLTPSWSWTDSSTTASAAAIVALGAPVMDSQTITSSFGSLGDGVGYGLTHQSITSSAGTITSEVDLTLGSLTATFTEGQLLNQIQINGQTATFTEGTITTAVQNNPTLALSGLSASFAQGILFDNVSYVLDNTQQGINLIGQTATFALGLLQPNIIAPLTAQTLASTEGTITPAPGYVLGSLSITSLEGNITANAGNNANASLVGQNITSSQGVMQFLPGATFPSGTLTFTEGTITFSATGDFTVSLTGQTINSGEGALTSVLSAPGFLTMPNVVGIGWLHASHILEKAGLFQTQPPIRVESKVYPVYTVLGQEPPAGSLIPFGGAVQLTVSIDAPLLGASFDVIPLF